MPSRFQWAIDKVHPNRANGAMTKAYRVAVVGATGLVGGEMIQVLEERGFPVSELLPLASVKSLGSVVHFQDKDVDVQVARPEAFENVDIALFSAGGALSKELAPEAAKRGAIVIDNSSAWRMDPEVPLVVPEVNAKAIAGYKTKNIIANPNCSTIQMVVALAPLHAKAGLNRVTVSTYQAVSGAGREAMDELREQVGLLFRGEDIEPSIFPHPIAFNAIPRIDVPSDDGYTKEEWKMVFETRKIMDLPELAITPTCVRVPVFNGHAESVIAEFDAPISVGEAREALKNGPGLFVQDEIENDVYPTQLEVNGSDATCVGRIRPALGFDNGLAFWCVADNLRKGAASNAVQIAEVLVRDHL